MKKILLAATLIVALTSAAFAGGKDSKMLGDLKQALKTSQTTWQTTESYKKASFSFNGKSAHAYFDVDENLIGFSIVVSVNDLPQGAMENISSKYQGWTVTEAILFIDGDGTSTYYAQVAKNKHNLALRISENGKASIYAKMPN